MRVSRADRRDGVIGYEVESGHGPRRAPGTGAHGRHGRLGTARAPADADEPRGGVPVAHHRKTCPRRPQPERNPRMSNVLAIAHKELKSYFASPIAYIVIGSFALRLRLLLCRDGRVLRPRQPADGPDGRRSAVGERQRDDDPAVDAERPDPRAVHHADAHDADLRRGKALGHHRAAADVAAHRLPDRPRQVPRRDDSLRDHARR